MIHDDRLCNRCLDHVSTRLIESKHFCRLEKPFKLITHQSVGELVRKCNRHNRRDFYRQQRVIHYLKQVWINLSSSTQAEKFTLVNHQKTKVCKTI